MPGFTKGLGFSQFIKLVILQDGGLNAVQHALVCLKQLRQGIQELCIELTLQPALTYGISEF